MILPLLRPLLLVLCTAASFLVLGRAPGAVSLRTRDIETVLTADGKTGRDRGAGGAWLEA